MDGVWQPFRARDGSHASTVTIMAFLGGGGDLDRGERQRLQEYEDLVDLDYDPFHEKCGKDVFFSDTYEVVALILLM